MLSRKSTGDATNNDVTSSVAVVSAILCTVADVRNHTHGIQQIHPAVTCFYNEFGESAQIDGKKQKIRKMDKTSK